MNNASILLRSDPFYVYHFCLSNNVCDGKNVSFLVIIRKFRQFIADIVLYFRTSFKLLIGMLYNSSHLAGYIMEQICSCVYQNNKHTKLECLAVLRYYQLQ